MEITESVLFATNTKFGLPNYLIDEGKGKGNNHLESYDSLLESGEFQICLSVPDICL